MAINELGACEWFVWDLRRSNLIERGRLDQIAADFIRKHPRADPPALAEHLVKQGILTAFQAERVLQGKTQGLVLGPYTFTDALGSGSMGTVYKALNKSDDRWYAVKVVPRRSMWNVSIARRQVRAFERCRHPGVVRFVDVGTSGGMHYLAWPFVEGQTLDQLVSRETKLAPGVAAHYLLQAAEGLDDCHQQGLFHGLLKPSDLMITPDQQVRLLDCGIGSLLAETNGESLVDTMSTANALTSGLDCVSPESIADPTNRSPAGDQYSLGCILYYCLAGRYPFADGSALEKIAAHQLKQPPPIRDCSPGVPEPLVAVVERLLQKAPEARFGSMAEVVEILRPLAQAPAAGPAGMRRPPVDEAPAAHAVGQPEECVIAGALPAPESVRDNASAADPENHPPKEDRGRSVGAQRQRPSWLVGLITCVFLIGVLASLIWTTWHQ